MNIIKTLQAHQRNIAISHTIFDLPFAFMGAFVAAGATPDLLTLVLIALAITGARSAALTIDNLVDIKFDKDQPRFSKRPMVTGELSKTDAIIFIIICLMVCLLAVLQMPRICLYLLPIASIPFIVYPFVKRFSFTCHAVLGLAIAMAPAGGYMAVAGEKNFPAFEMILLCLAVGIWIGAFDIVYGMQDEKFDREHNLHSVATEFGAKNGLLMSKIFHVISILCFIWLGVLKNFHGFYFFGVCLAAATLFYQHKIVAPYHYEKITQDYFLRNGIVSAALFICTWLELAL